MYFEKHPRIDDDIYLASFNGRVCEACGADDGTIVGAHLRAGHEAGKGQKPSDDLVVALCFDCHKEADQSLEQDRGMGTLIETYAGLWWWVEKLLKPMLRRRYQVWSTDSHLKAPRRPVRRR